ncbi:trehalose-phosphatase [Uliginosibacterium sp. H3]|uniref:Trehalose 6-phosphate phosphatase n=1 Tax=Uliginosibacterium silvisoli TaxID=3114758 RepID=A0ABU6K2H3_9RHOO|nr:trehalose-phosphatase [Uliginosibacterium sp. H3]
MKYIFSPDNQAALQQALTGKVLFAFDYDGTLAPITAHYADTSTPSVVIQSLKELAATQKVVIITGRSVADVSSRLGFTPYAIVGNHGAEGLGNANAGKYAALVAAWRTTIETSHADDFRAAGIVLEDKGCSLSLHYRQAHDLAAARQLILQACAALSPPARIFGGKCIVNITPHDAPDKADALLTLARTEGVDTAVFVGDDQNDEVVFERAPTHWLTVRVGETPRSAARYYLERQAEMATFIETILLLLAQR